MLPRLPQEIIIMIARHLNFYSKMNLAKTCKKLNYTLYITVLYENIIVPSKRTDKVFLFFKKKPLYASRVKICDLLAVPKNKILLSQLSKIFPNLTKLSCGQLNTFNIEEDTATECIKGLRNTLHECDDYFRNILLKLIPQYEFKKLTKITISNISGFFGDSSRSFAFFKNTPALISLKLTRSTVHIAVLENLHENCPKLKYLSLDNFDSVTNTIRPNSNIKPAHNMESFMIDTQILRNYNYSVILKYVIKKYPNLKSLQLHFRGQLNQLEDRSVDGIPPTIMSNMLSRVQSLHISLCMFRNIINTMDLTEVNIRHLTAILRCDDHSTLFMSPRGRSGIQSLLLLTSLSLPISQFLDLTDRGNALPNLKTLYVCRSYNRYDCSKVAFDKILRACPNLEALDIYASKSTLFIESIIGDRHLFLRDMKLDVSTTNAGVFSYIKYFVPMLNYFNLNTFIIQDQDELVFDFPHHDFYQFDAVVCRSMYNNSLANIHYHIVTPKGETRIKYDRHASRIYRMSTTINRWSREYMKKNQFLKIICNNLFELKCGGITII